MNLRDWQKKASERRDAAAQKISTAWANDTVHGGIKAVAALGFDSRDSEIDLLLQIIEKQSAALEFYTYSETWANYATVALEDGGSEARTVQAEVQGLVEKLTGEK